MGWFFFSSRRRHTRLQGDWSSDVCSSDLGERPRRGRAETELHPLDAGEDDQLRRAERERHHRRGEVLVDDAFEDRKSTRLNSSHLVISYAVFCLKKKTS